MRIGAIVSMRRQINQVRHKRPRLVLPVHAILDRLDNRLHGSLNRLDNSTILELLLLGCWAETAGRAEPAFAASRLVEGLGVAG
jgi:hypothetical protein